MTILAGALIYASFPIFAAILFAAVVHALASCVLGPCIAASRTCRTHGHCRTPRSQRGFASIGNGLAAAAVGHFGYFFATSRFLVTAILAMPTLVALSQISAAIIPERAWRHKPRSRQVRQHLIPEIAATSFAARARRLPYPVHLANAALLPLMGTVVTTRSSEWATVLIGACIVVPQIIVAAIAPSVGTHSRWGRRTLLLIGVGALPIRAVLFAIVTDPYLLVAVPEILDGLTAAIIGVIVPSHGC